MIIARALAVSAAALLAFLPAPARAGAPTDQINSGVDQVIRVLQDPKLKGAAMEAERRAAIRQEAESIFDFGETGRRALGRHWQELDESQQREFVSMFTDLLEHAYIARIEQYSGEQIVYSGDTVDGDTATVRTKFITQKGTEIPVDYRLLRRGDRWLAYDAIVEGVSLVSNYRTQFDHIMRTGSYPELARRMRAHQSEFGAPAGQSARPPKS
jgi:phospholipid transport system substrate-binding protein